MNNKFLFYALIFVMINLQTISGLFFILDPYEVRCISREMKENSTFTGVYFISGEKEDYNRAFIKSEDGIVLWQAYNQKTSNFNYIITKDGKLIY